MVVVAPFGQEKVLRPASEGKAHCCAAGHRPLVRSLGAITTQTVTIFTPYHCSPLRIALSCPPLPYCALFDLLITVFDRFLSEKTLKFDNLCHNFYQHEDLDSTGAVLTASKDATGAIIGMTLDAPANSGAPIPLTVPTSSAASISLGNLNPAKTETYGSDTTYTFATGNLDEGTLSKPALSE